MPSFLDAYFEDTNPDRPAQSPMDAAIAAEGISGHRADVVRSLYQQESGGGRNTRTSNAGAVGGMQIIPATFASVADPGWDINDPVQNARAGIRYAMQGYDASGGDPALTGAYYYGGPGGMRKAQAGIAVSDPRNPHAPNTLQYGAQIAARVGGRGGMQMPATLDPDELDSAARSIGRSGSSWLDPAVFTEIPAAPEPVAPPPGKRTWGQAIGDTLAQAGAGVNELAQSAISVVAPESDAAAFFGDNADTLRSWQSDSYKATRAAADKRVQEAEQAAGGGLAGIAATGKQALSEAWDNPAIASDYVASNIVSFLPGLGAIKGAQLAGFGARGALAASAGTNAFLNAGDARSDAFQRIKKAYTDTGMSEAEAEQRAIEESRLPAAVGGVAGALGGSTGAEAVFAGAARKAGMSLGRGTMTDVLQRATDSSLKTAAKRTLGTTGKEILGEIPEEVAALPFTNTAVGNIDGKTDWAEGVGGTAVAAAIGSGPMGTYAGVREARQDAGHAREMAQVLADPNLDPQIKARARDAILALAEKNRVPPEQIDAWLDSEFMADDARQAQIDADARAAQVDEEVRRAQEQRFDEQVGAARWRDETAERRDGLLDQMAPENDILGALRERETTLAQERAAASERAEGDRERMLGVMGSPTDPLRDTLEQRRQSVQQAANAEEAAFQAELNRRAPTQPLVDTPNSQFMASMGQRAASESAPRRPVAPSPVPTPTPAPQTQAQQVASAEASRNQRARKEYGIHKTGALATFAEIDQMYVDGVLSEGQFNVMAGMLAGDAVRLGDVRAEVAGIKQEARLAEPAQMEPMKNGTPPSDEAIAQIKADFGEPTATAAPADTRSRGDKLVDDFNEKAKTAGRAAITRENHRQWVKLAMGFDIDGHPPADGVLNPRTWKEVGEAYAEATGKAAPSEKTISQSMRVRGFTQENLKRTAAVATQDQEVQSAEQDAIQNEEPQGESVVEEAAPTQSEADVAAAEDGTPGQEERDGGPTTEMDTNAIDTARMDERASRMSQEVLDANQISDELARALRHNGKQLDTVPAARASWDESKPGGLSFDELPVAKQAEYVQAVVRNETLVKGKPLLSAGDLIRLEDEIVASLLAKPESTGEVARLPSLKGDAAKSQTGDSVKTWATPTALFTAVNMTSVSQARVQETVPSKSIGKFPETNLDGTTATVFTFDTPPGTLGYKVLAAQIRTVLASPAGKLAKRIFGQLKTVTYYKAKNSPDDLETAHAMFHPRFESVLVNADGPVLEAINKPGNMRVAAGLAGVMTHEAVQHGADYFGGKALGLNRAATTYTGGPLAVGVNYDKANGTFSLELGPVIKELLDVYRTGSNAGVRGLDARHHEAADDDGHASGTGSIQPAAGKTAGTDRLESQERQTPSRPADDVSKQGKPRWSVGGLSFRYPLEELARLVDAADAHGGVLPLRNARTAAERAEILRDIAHEADTASREAWAVLGEVMQSKPDLLREHAPSAHALVEAVWNADTDLEVGQLLAGTSEAKLESTGAPDTKPLLKRSAAPTNETPVQAAERVNEVAKDALQVGRDGFGVVTRTVSMLSDLVDMASKSLPSARSYFELVRRGQADRVKSERNIDSVLDDFFKLTAAERGEGAGTVNAFLKDTTTEKKWGFKPEWQPNAVVDPVMAAKFNVLSPQAQAVVKRVLQHGHDSIKLLRQQALAAIAHESDALIEDARRRGDTAAVRKAEDAKLASTDAFSGLAALDTDWPYAPLKRFGNYVVIYRSPELKAQEAILAGREATDDEKSAARAQIKVLRQDGAHYGVWFREGRREGRKLATQLKAQYGDENVENFARESNEYRNQGDMISAFHKLRDMVDNSVDEQLREKSSQALNQLMADLHLSLLAEHSARQAGRRRETVAGADDNMMRAFETHGRALANFTAALHNTREVQEQIANMRREARENTTVGSTEQRQDYFNEILRRHMMGLDYSPGALNNAVNRAMSATSTWMLLTSVSYHVNNALQPWAMSMPLMAAKHGYGRSQAALLQAYKDVAPALKDGRISQSDFAALPEDVRAAVNTLADQGAIMISLEQEMGRWGGQGNPAVVKATRLLSRVAQTTEALNRLATAVAAVRLENQQGRTGDAAVAYARQIIDQTHGDYGGYNAPRFMRHPVGRLMTQFRKFQIIQLSLWARMAHDAFKGESAETRAFGRRALLFSLGHMGAIGGLVGMPGFTFIAFLLNGMMGGDDEPWDTEEEFRKWVGDDALGRILTRGMPFAAGVDISGRAGAGQMLSLLPYTDLKATREGYESAVTSALGPFVGGLMPKAVDGVGLMGQGQLWKGAEMMLPKGVADFSKALRQGTHGVTNRRGDVVMSPEELDLMDGVLQGIGFPTTASTERGYKANVKYQYEQFIKARTQALQREYVEAVKAGDTEARATAIKEWLAFQKSRQERGFKPQALSTLIGAAKNQAKRERDVIGGIPFNSQNKGYVEALVGGDDEE